MRCAKRALLLTATLLVLIPAADTRAEYEGAAFGVDNYGTSSQGLCCSGCDDLPNAADTARGFRDGLSGIGYSDLRVNTNTGVDGRDWTDGNAFTWGADDNEPWGTDWADAVFYCGHGGYSCGSARSSRITMGDFNSGETCSPNTRSHMRFGEGGANEDANIAVLYACHSMQRCVWSGGGYNNVDAGDQFTTINGFHGTAWLYGDTPGRVQNYVTGAKYNGIGDDWVEQMTAFRFWWWEHEQCAVSLVWGSSRSNRDLQYNWGGYRDFKSTGSHSANTYYYMCGCDPEGGPRLPDC